MSPVRVGLLIVKLCDLCLQPALEPETLWNSHFQKQACKLSGMNTSKTLDLKPFRMNTCRKTGEGAPHSRAGSKSKSPAADTRNGRDGSRNHSETGAY